MRKNKHLLIVLIICTMVSKIQAQSWVDSVDLAGRQVFMPANNYKWDWGQATFLHSLVQLYNAKPEAEKTKYLEYIKTAMDATYSVANGKHPNAVASGHGMAFLARIDGAQKYLSKAEEIYADYLKTPRASNGGVSHRAETVELWDDTVYMLSMFLLEMYRLTHDEKYIANFVEQFEVHHKELVDEKSGLWVHGWDADSINYNDGCSIMGWPDPVTHKSSQIWARGNGWVGMALADAIETVSPTSKYKKTLEKALVNYIQKVAPYQNPNTGLWYQLITLPKEPLNFEESSCTAMFAYSIAKAIQFKIIPKKKYFPIIEKAFKGLRSYCLRTGEGANLIPTKVSGGTCVGDKEYYLTRKITEGTGFGYGSFIMFGLAYEGVVSGK